MSEAGTIWATASIRKKECCGFGCGSLISRRSAACGGVRVVGRPELSSDCSGCGDANGSWFLRHRPSGTIGRFGAQSPQRRTIGVVARGLIERAATTPMVRRRPASWPGQQTASRSPREPGMDLVRSATRRRGVPPAQSHARHPDWGGVFPRVLVRLR